MPASISHDWDEETPEAKARWFQSLTLAQRMELLCAYTDLALAANPNLPDLKDAQQTERGIPILSAT